jgi:FAD:protein FMN transferase
LPSELPEKPPGGLRFLQLASSTRFIALRSTTLSYALGCLLGSASLCLGQETAAEAEAQVEAQADNRSPMRFEFTQIQMGMPFKLVLYAADEDSANGAARAAYARIRELNGIMSDYEPDSELSRLCATAGTGKSVPISPDLLRILLRAQALAKASDGAFDVTVGPCVRLWRKARREKSFPTPAEFAAARRAVGWSNLTIDEEHATARLALPRMQLDLGGIAVGYAIDETLALLKARGITSALIDGSGDIGVSAAPPGTTGWKIGIAPLEPEAPPSRYIVLAHAAVTTSGSAFQYVEFEGKRYSHIVDPHTGLGLTDRASVTVIARDCTTADSYATAVSVLGAQRGLALIEKTEGAAALIVRQASGKSEVIESQRLRDY